MDKRITRLLVANRGEIARRIMRTARAMGIQTVAVYADPDADAPFVREAGESVALGGKTSTETYLDIGKIVEAARRTGADAVHPGYGFLSENAAFARAVIDAGLTWVGPHPEAIAAMGDKLAAKKLMHDAGVPILHSIELDGDVDDAVLAQAEAIGYPVLVKAAGGGGGRGMRIVNEGSKLKNAVSSARREAKSAFGNETVFVEKYLEKTRHVEVQVFGDKHGNVVHLFERECSIQRRHQKIIEESPSSAVSHELRERIGLEAVAAARAIGYDNAGTVEFLLDAKGHFYFLEVNTRLQVEHPVTEAITGYDLVREQIRVAEGDLLSFAQQDLRINGHAIEARLYAEDPAKDFFPSPGTVLAWLPPTEPDARVDSGVESGSEISVFFDPMLAKVIAHAPTRTEASLKLALVLERLRVPGLTTNRDFLVNVLRHEAFLAGDTTTDFIDRVQPARTRTPSPQDLRFAALAATVTGEANRRATARVHNGLPSGWRNNASQAQWVAFAAGGIDVRCEYTNRGGGVYEVTIDGVPGTARVAALDGGAMGIEIDGLRRTMRVIARDDRFYTHDGRLEVTLVEQPRFPEGARAGVAGGSHVAPMPGKVISVNVNAGDRVAAGQVLVVVEAMKMEHHISAANGGMIKEVLVSAGQQVEAGAPLVVIEA